MLDAKRFFSPFWLFFCVLQQVSVAERAISGMDRAWAKDTRRSPGVKKVMSLVDGKSRRLSEFVEVRCVGMVFGVLRPFRLAEAGVETAQEEIEKDGKEFVVFVFGAFEGGEVTEVSEHSRSEWFSTFVADTFPSFYFSNDGL